MANTTKSNLVDWATGLSKNKIDSFEVSLLYDCAKMALNELDSLDEKKMPPVDYVTSSYFFMGKLHAIRALYDALIEK